MTALLGFALQGGSPSVRPSVALVHRDNLRSLQLAELDILKEFMRVCEANHFRYYLAYGTLLGAVRHQGFIPWDDDIDVAMPRSDYRKFAAACDTQVSARTTWHSYMTDADYGLFGKLICAGTAWSDRTTADHRYQQAAFIDIFPLDGTPSNRLGRQVHRLLVKLCSYRLQLGSVRRHGAKRALAAATRPIPRAIAITLMERLASRFPFDGSRIVFSVGGPYGYSAEARVAELWGDGAPQAFEAMFAVGPTDWKAYLKGLYGDYMTLPAEDMRKGHHGPEE